MNGLLLPGLLVLALVAVLFVWRARRARVVSCSLQETLMTSERHREFAALQALLQGEVQLFTHVRLKDVLLPGKGVGKGKWQKQLASMGDRQFDYLLCDPEDLSLVCAVERLAPGQGKRRPSRDRWLQQLCERADLPLLLLVGQEAADLDELREQVQALLLAEDALDPLMEPALSGGARREPTFNPQSLGAVDLGDTPRPLTRPQADAASGRTSKGAGRRHDREQDADKPPLDLPMMRSLPQTFASGEPEAMPQGVFTATSLDEDEEGMEQDHKIHDQDDAAPAKSHACPRCSAPLLDREARKGPYAGKQFLTCTRFPECRYATLKPNPQH
ncbi:DUF2726 domain-containing protein [Aeromonas rivuli]|uniref:DUF2726 domain-containing protein n=1 Tax=Aeromonas rivuli TaxID=648794 RepID=UPI001CCF8217|nr:DUF2726 domain-containing protein [Aeromonas rivuli]UBO72814.1 DUF2726 domain-containing protein [Aeromonas rivuli]